MAYIGEVPGLGIRSEFVYTASAAQATFSGNDDNGLFLNYTVGLINVYINGVLQVNGSDYTATDGTSVVFGSGLSASDIVTVEAYGAFSPADTYTKTESDTKLNRKATIVDTRRNLITNPCMQVSQENGDTAGTTTAYYVADEWSTAFLTSSGVVSTQRVQTPTLAGAENRLKISVTTPDTSLVAGEYFVMSQAIEASKIETAQFGTPEAKDLVFRFMGNFPVGTYAITLVNSALDRSFVREFTAVAGVDTVYEVTFPGDTSGTWVTGDVRWGLVYITLATGSTFQTTPDAWAGGFFLGTSSTSNGLSAIQSFEIGDVGLKLDPDGIGYGEFEVPDPAENLRACQRYYQKFLIGCYSNAAGANESMQMTGTFRNMRTTPTVALGTNYRNANTNPSYPPSTVTINEIGCFFRAISLSVGLVDRADEVIANARM